MDLPLGLTGRAVLRVTGADTAEAVGSGDVPVLATPRVLALAEAATVDALRGALPAGSTTVGVRVELAHLLPTPVGATATAVATLDSVDGRTLRFTVLVRDDAGPGGSVGPGDPAGSGGPGRPGGAGGSGGTADGGGRDEPDGRPVAEATVERAAVDRARFLARIPAIGRHDDQPDADDAADEGAGR